MRGDREWDALAAELRTTTPPCDGDDRFVCDNPSPKELADMSRICDACPLRVRTLCDAYAKAVRPGGSTWAGKHYPAKEA